EKLPLLWAKARTGVNTTIARIKSNLFIFVPLLETKSALRGLRGGRLIIELCAVGDHRPNGQFWNSWSCAPNNAIVQRPWCVCHTTLRGSELGGSVSGR